MQLAKLALFCTAGLALSSSAMADIVFTADSRVNDADPALWSVQLFSRSANSASVKVTSAQVATAIQAANPTFAGSSRVRLADVALGPNGDFIVTQGQAFVEANVEGAVLRVGNIYGPATVQAISAGGDLTNPIGVAYDSSTNSAIMVSNPGNGVQPSPSFIDGIMGANYGTGAQTIMYNESLVPPRPAYHAGGYIQPDPRGTPRTFLVGSIQGGINSTQTSTAGGPQLYRMTYDTALGNTTMSKIVDFTNPAETGVAEDFVDEATDRFTNGGIRGIAVIPGQDVVFVAMRHYGIWRVELTPAGAFSSMTRILDFNADPNSALFNGGIDAMDYDPYANKLVFGMDGANSRGLWEVNLDGSGANRLVAGVYVRGIDFIPTPGTALVLGLGGLLASRRRR